MNPLLSGVKLKMLPANQHLHDICTEVHQFGITGSYDLGIKFKANPPGYEIHVVVPDEPRAELGPIIGDFLHNLRSCLDHLVWALVLDCGGTPTDKTQFPIYSDLMVRNSTLIYDPAIGDRGKLNKITIAGGVSTTAFAIIEGLQPYYRVDDPTLDPLAILADLNNIDKHRILHPTAAKVGEVGAQLRRKKDGTVLVDESVRGAHKHGAVVAFIPVDPTWDPADMEMTGQYAPLVTLDVPGTLGEEELCTLLTDLRDYVRDEVVQRIAATCMGDRIPDLDPIFP